MEGHLRRIVRDDTAGAQAGGVGANTPEVIEPELRVEAAGIVFDERELNPAHGPIEPPGQRVARPRGRGLFLRNLPRRTKRCERAGAPGDFQKAPPGEVECHRHVLSECRARTAVSCVSGLAGSTGSRLTTSSPRTLAHPFCDAEMERRRGRAEVPSHCEGLGGYFGADGAALRAAGGESNLDAQAPTEPWGVCAPRFHSPSHAGRRAGVPSASPFCVLSRRAFLRRLGTIAVTSS
jgi:hypothetical protein